MALELATASRHALRAARFACRPRAWVGTAREIALGGFNVVTYPLGIRPGRPSWELADIKEIQAASVRLLLDPELAATPVLLVHGYAHNRSGFLAMSRQLKRAGFRHVDAFNYNALTDGIPEAAARLGAEVERVLAATGARRVMLVGHSMGGMVARYYVQQLGGEDTVDTVVTMGSPHRGTYASYIGIGRAAAQLRPGSELLDELEESARPGPVRWISYWSDLDVFVAPVWNARLDHPALAAHNVRVRDTGHLSLLASGWVLRDIVAHLTDPWLHRQAVTSVASLTTEGQRQRRAVAGAPTMATPTRKAQQA
jgi:triacylglycerol lipase